MVIINSRKRENVLHLCMPSTNNCSYLLHVLLKISGHMVIFSEQGMTNSALNSLIHLYRFNAIWDLYLSA
jgi:hypothetical protein